MTTRVQKWGNSLALRIPKAFADETRLQDDSLVELTLENGRLVIVPMRPVRPATEESLDELLALVTDENVHVEVDWRPTVGNETW